MSKSKLENVANIVRALVTSQKQPVFLSNILTDYNDVEGEKLPFTKMGFPSAEALLNATGQFTFSRIGTQTCISANYSEKSSHIARMVQNQKSKNKRVGNCVKQQKRRPTEAYSCQGAVGYYNRNCSSNVVNRGYNNNNNNNNYNNNSIKYRHNNKNNKNNNNTQQHNNNYNKNCNNNNNGPQNNNYNNNSHYNNHNNNFNYVNSSSSNTNNNRNNIDPFTQINLQRTALLAQQNQMQEQEKRLSEQQKLLQALAGERSQLRKEKELLAKRLNDRENLLLKKQQEANTQKKQLEEAQRLAVKSDAKQSAGTIATKSRQENEVRAVIDLREKLNARKNVLQKQQEELNQKQKKKAQQLEEAEDMDKPLRAILGQTKYGKNTKDDGGSHATTAQLKQDNSQSSGPTLIQTRLDQQQQQQQQQQKPLNLIHNQTKSQKPIEPPLQHPQQQSKQNTMELKQKQQQQQPRQPTRSVQTRLKVTIPNNYAAIQQTNRVISSVSLPTTDGHQSLVSNNQKRPAPAAAAAANGFNGDKHADSIVINDLMAPIIPPAIFQFNSDIDAVTSLAQYCIVRKYRQPEYVPYKTKTQNKFMCRVDVNGQQYSSYPHEFTSENMAKEKAAAQAIEKIKMSESRRFLPPCNFNDCELLQHIYKGLLKHPHGIFTKNMSDWFERTFERQLPENWWSLVQKSNKFKTEMGINNSVIIFANTTGDDLATQFDDFRLTPSPKPLTNDDYELEPIKLPWHDDCWSLLITHCLSTVEVWARLFGSDYSERFNTLTKRMEQFMLQHAQPQQKRATPIVRKHIYLVNISDCWHRVRVESTDEEKQSAYCFFIDFGDADWLFSNTLYDCPEQFLQLAPQALKFSLYGLEDFAGNPHARQILDTNLVLTSVVAKIFSKANDYQPKDENSNIQAVFFDTSSQEDRNLNDELLEKICENTPPPTIKMNIITNVVVTYINEVGDLYLQILNDELKYVKRLIAQIVDLKFKREHHQVTYSDLQIDNMFLICDDSCSSPNGAETPVWYRGALTAKPKSEARSEAYDVYYVDIGRTRRTHISKIYRLESLSTALSKFPPQAVKVRLENIPEISKQIVGRMRGLLPVNCDALVKVIVNEPVPLVLAYTRQDDKIITINETIRFEQECGLLMRTNSQSPTHSNCSSLADFKLTVNSVPNSPQHQRFADLPYLKEFEAIPALGVHFEVRVTCCANPSNFTLQSYKEYPSLRIMMRDLQDYCETNNEFIAADMIEIGQAYAAKNKDGFYHRVIVLKKLGDFIHICYCDFGDVSTVRCDQLKILPLKFRRLPKMGIQAKLYGIKSCANDWSMDDCIRFRELTVGQKFVSIIKKVTRIKDGYSDEEIDVLNLELIDVSTEEDIYISQVLLKEKRAIGDVVTPN